MNNTIWALFSVTDDFGQPDNNLMAWWFKKPSIDTLAGYVGINLAEKVFKGDVSRDIVTDYRLREIKEGEVII